MILIDKRNFRLFPLLLNRMATGEFSLGNLADLPYAIMCQQKPVEVIVELIVKACQVRLSGIFEL